MTAQELLTLARKQNPKGKYATNTEQTAIGVWNSKLGRYQAVAFLLDNGHWVHLAAELLIDGQPKPETWVSV